MSTYDHLRESVGLDEAKVEIKLPHEDPVAVGKIVYKSGRVEYWYKSKSGAKAVYPNAVKFRYQLRNAANVPNANKLVDKLDAQLPTPKKGKKRESADASEYDRIRESLGLTKAADASQHWVETCRECGTIISQCRCKDRGHKIQREGICDKCKKLSEAGLSDSSKGEQEAERIVRRLYSMATPVAISCIDLLLKKLPGVRKKLQ